MEKLLLSSSKNLPDDVQELPIYWLPQPRQLVCLQACGLSHPFDGSPLNKAVADIVGYGGSAGGGKTDTMLAVALVAMLVYPGINIAYFRRKFPQLSGLGGAIERSKQVYPQEYFEYNQGNYRWTAHNDSKLQFNHCNNPVDVENYQSQQFDILLIDETTQFTPDMIKFLITRNRATVEHESFKPFTLMGTNPGGVGHSYFRDGFVYLGEPEKVHDFKNETGVVMKHIFIPSKLQDNQELLRRDPTYGDRLSPDKKIKKRLLDGDWSAFEGQVFDEFKVDTHVMRALDPGDVHTYTLSLDWGYASTSAFAGYLHAAVKMETEDGLKFNRVITPQEWYGNKASPEAWAERIFKTCFHKPERCKADPKMFSTDDGSTSIAKRMEAKWKELNDGKTWVRIEKADNSRISGWGVMHDWLSMAPDGLPYWMVTDNCINLIRTLPDLVYDDVKDEDVDTELEDHAADSCRYGLTSIKFIGVKPGSFSVVKSSKKKYLSTDERGLPAINPREFFGSLS